jgi:transposase
VQSKNKPAPTAAERRHIERLKQMDCIVCGAEGVEVHEPEQGLWFASMPLCPVFHGQRLNWKAKKWTEIDAINATVRKLMENA